MSCDVEATCSKPHEEVPVVSPALIPVHLSLGSPEIKIIRLTTNFVNEPLGQGPIIAQSVIPIDHTPSAQKIAQAGRDLEKIALARSLKMVFVEQVFVHGNQTVIFN